jgi:hypothetical protein
VGKGNCWSSVRDCGDNSGVDRGDNSGVRDEGGGDDDGQGKGTCWDINLVVWQSDDEGVDGESKGESGKIVRTGDRR